MSHGNNFRITISQFSDESTTLAATTIDMMVTASESSISSGVSDGKSTKSAVGCALRIELLVLECSLPEDISTLALCRDTRRVIFVASAGVRTVLHVIAPVPRAEGTAPAPVKLELRLKNGHVKSTRDIALGALLAPQGCTLRSLVRGKGALTLKCGAHVLTDPVRELPAANCGTLELADYRTESRAALGKCAAFRDCARARFAIPPINQQCGLKDAKGTPVITTIEAPRQMWAWTMARPDEPDEIDRDGEYIDIGDGVFAPKRNVNRLRTAFGTEKEKCRIKASHGKMSLLQASFMRPVEESPPLTTPLGPPISLRSSPVVETIHLLAASDKYIEEVEVSDSDSAEVFDPATEHSDEEVFSLADEEEEEEQRQSIDTVLKKMSITGGVTESPQPMALKLPSIREKVQRMMSVESDDPETFEIQKVPSIRGQVIPQDEEPEPSSAKFGESSEEDEPDRGYSHLMKKVEDVERERNALRRELTYAHAERDRLVEQLRAQSLATRCVALEAELMVLRRAHDKAVRENMTLIRKIEDLEKGQAKIEKKKIEKAHSSEYDRLLEVIACLNEELARQPAQDHILEELLMAKEALVSEKIEKEELAREVSVLKTQIQGSPISPTRLAENS